MRPSAAPAMAAVSAAVPTVWPSRRPPSTTTARTRRAARAGSSTGAGSGSASLLTAGAAYSILSSPQRRPRSLRRDQPVHPVAHQVAVRVVGERALELGLDRLVMDVRRRTGQLGAPVAEPGDVVGDDPVGGA